MNSKQINIAAIYCRLSSDDGQTGESGSIQTQRTLLTQYCRENGFAIGGYFCDDGWSGTNFERPDFKRMLAEIEAKTINMVIVKDLSRFGREYAQMGMYIEHFFPEHEVRFISVAEGIDTINGTDNLLMPLTNVINSLYAKESSSKTKAAHKALAKAGKYIGSHAPFGYVKDPNDRHHLVVDPMAADVVRDIFRMFSEGIGYVRMTKILRERSIPNPQAYFNRNNPDYFQSDYWRQDFDWHATSVRVILQNPVYLGKTVFGRTKGKSFYQKERVKTDVSEWIVVENTHEPIVTQELWDTVQKMMESKRRETKDGEIQMFSGLVKCAGCGSSLNVSRNSKGKYTGFSCWVYKNYGKERCTSHAIGWKTLCTLVLEDIQCHARVASIAKHDYSNMLQKAKSEKLKKENDKDKRELRAAEKRIGELDKIIAKLYADNALGKLTDERYGAMSAAYEAEQQTLKEKRDRLTASIEQAEKVMQEVHDFVDLIRQFTDIQELNAKILNTLINKIIIHEKTVNPDGSKSQRVDIHYKFIGYLEPFQGGMLFIGKNDGEQVVQIPETA